MWSSKALQEKKGDEIRCGLENVEGDNIWIRLWKMGKITGCFGKEEFKMSEKSINNDCLKTLEMGKNIFRESKVVEIENQGNVRVQGNWHFQLHGERKTI